MLVTPERYQPRLNVSKDRSRKVALIASCDSPAERLENNLVEAATSALD